MRQRRKRKPRREAKQNRETTQSRRAEARHRRKPAEFRAMSVEMCEPQLAGESRSFIGSAQKQPNARKQPKAKTNTQPKGAHLAPLTPLNGAAHARGCIRRAGEQRRLRGALQAHGAFGCAA